MARSIGSDIPAEIRRLFAGADLEAGIGHTFFLLTVSEAGWPHLAMLSVGEVLAVGPRDLRLALWPGSTTTANLDRTGQATLALIHGGAGYSLRCRARRGPDLALASGRLAYFEVQVEDVQEDAVSYAVLETGVTYRLHEPRKVLSRWQEAVDALRRQPAST